MYCIFKNISIEYIFISLLVYINPVEAMSTVYFVSLYYRNC